MELRTVVRATICAGLVAALAVPGGCSDPKRGTLAGTVAPDTVVAGADVSIETPTDTDTSEDEEDGASGVPELVPCGRQVLDLPGLEDVAALLVIDRSSSMAKDDKWSVTQDAIHTALSGGYDRHIRFGLLMFPRADGACDVGSSADVPLGLGNGDAIVSAMVQAPTLRGTPTGTALRAARDILLEEAPDADHRVVVLATDGAPACPSACWMCASEETGACTGGDCEACDSRFDCAVAEAIVAVDDLAAEGVPTYVIGILGSGSVAPVLDAFAVHGGTALGGAERDYYATSSGDELAAALIDIALDANGCAVALSPPDDGYAAMVVSTNGQTLPRDPAHAAGWDVDASGTTLRFYGSACLTAVDAPAETVLVTYLCEERAR